MEINSWECEHGIASAPRHVLPTFLLINYSYLTRFLYIHVATILLIVLLHMLSSA